MSVWKCKKHRCLEHDIFINYRVRTEKDLATRLQLELSMLTVSDGRHPVVFLDRFCLQDGEEWQVGFLEGLHHSKLALLLISEEGIERIQNANVTEDNVLLEYEYVLEAKRAERMKVLPLLVKNKNYTPFSKFSVDVYPNERHISPRSTTSKTIRETMADLFALNGISIAWDDECIDKLPAIMQKLQEALDDPVINPPTVPMIRSSRPSSARPSSARPPSASGSSGRPVSASTSVAPRSVPVHQVLNQGRSVEVISSSDGERGFVLLKEPNEVQVLDASGAVLFTQETPGEPVCGVFGVYRGEACLVVGCTIPDVIAFYRIASDHLDLIHQRDIDDLISSFQHEEGEAGLICSKPAQLVLRKEEEEEELWILTDQESGDPTILLYYPSSQRTQRPPYIRDDSLSSFDLRDFRLKAVRGQVWGIPMATTPSTLYILDNDQFATLRGHDFDIVSEATDAADGPRGGFIIGPNHTLYEMEANLAAQPVKPKLKGKHSIQATPFTESLAWSRDCVIWPSHCLSYLASSDSLLVVDSYEQTVPRAEPKRLEALLVDSKSATTSLVLLEGYSGSRCALLSGAAVIIAKSATETSVTVVAPVARVERPASRK